MNELRAVQSKTLPAEFTLDTRSWTMVVRAADRHTKDLKLSTVLERLHGTWSSGDYTLIERTRMHQGDEDIWYLVYVDPAGMLHERHVSPDGLRKVIRQKTRHMKRYKESTSRKYRQVAQEAAACTWLLQQCNEAKQREKEQGGRQPIKVLNIEAA